MWVKGRLVIISSPSGGGKNAVVNELLKIVPFSARLITTTTRPMRPGEKDGVDYYFIEKSEFEEKIKRGDFLEYNIYADNYYGAEKEILEQFLSKYQIVFSLTEVNGKRNLDKAGVKNLSIFLMPENMEVLRERIKERGGTSARSIEERLETAEIELNEAKNYDFIVENKEGKISETVEKIAKIIKERLNIDKKSKIS